MIAVDLDRLAAAHGDLEWKDPIPETSDHQRMAARVITDFYGSKPQDVALDNATHWINRAYDVGFSAGLVCERKRWQEKLATLFDIPVAR